MSTTPAAPQPVRSADLAALAFRVGIVGHRPNRLPDEEPWPELKDRLDVVLGTVSSTLQGFKDQSDAALYATSRIIMTAVTPLAEGTDRVFAKAAVKNHFRLFCPLPFDVGEFRFIPP